MGDLMVPFIVLAVVVVALLRLAVRIAAQWERAVVLRLGRFAGLRGPGLFVLIPFVDRVQARVDLRIRTTAIRAEEALTRDTVAIAMDAIVFWRVSDAARAALEIDDYALAVERVAQTSLREMIGTSDLSRLLSDRQAADQRLRAEIGAKTAGWGVEIMSVEIRDIGIPSALQDAMSRQAQAERERQARETLAAAEIGVARQVVEAAAVYGADPVALRLRQMNLIYEMNKERGATILIPTDLAAALGQGVLGQGLTNAAASWESLGDSESGPISGA
ncbi:SPFH domain-containing protein [Acetobacteraceae bacterium KSS8]|uniref:SPFH domain-containing protein n=1 Tax=Endosaccharibacter trunci TaxID=2812733 RepID=A0ABT1W2B7_9PROT|nr:SPFH domain-containing protein [Acetobacteraceae bacterium KSS8]